MNHLNRRSGPHPLPLSLARTSQALKTSFCPLALRNMQLAGLKGPRVLCRHRPLFRLLLLLPLLPWPVSRAQTTSEDPSALTVQKTTSAPSTPGSPSAPVTPGTSSALSLRERVQALMRNFPLVDGCVGSAWESAGIELTP